MGREEGTDRVEVLHEGQQWLTHCMLGVKIRTTPKCGAWEQWYSTGGSEAATADQRRALVPGQLGLRLLIPAGEVTLPGTWWALTKCLSNEWMNELLHDLGQVV